ncbi:hypothetical protein F3087_29165 [Nocardia colli]|uniref:Uncharacterized protein n=1 Tax=Nocardia colli TaxID=2545717 RepID=A0A5N0EE65_9NOCA|nr:hypothetical protein [Nocardia colli]KAA8885701.1 hypothetical protein F3087_29165 [Nocardia colli]
MVELGRYGVWSWARARSGSADGGSDRLIDAVVATGAADTILTELDEHFDAGADHVAIQQCAYHIAPGR